MHVVFMMQIGISLSEGQMLIPRRTGCMACSSDNPGLVRGEAVHLVEVLFQDKAPSIRLRLIDCIWQFPYQFKRPFMIGFGIFSTLAMGLTPAQGPIDAGNAAFGPWYGRC